MYPTSTRTRKENPSQQGEKKTETDFLDETARNLQSYDPTPQASQICPKTTKTAQLRDPEISPRKFHAFFFKIAIQKQVYIRNASI
jgi:hypothetical protein